MTVGRGKPMTGANMHLRDAMRKAGFRTMKALSEATGVSYQTIFLYAHLQSAATYRDGKWTSAVVSIAGALSVPPESLFPTDYLQKKLSDQNVKREVDLTELQVVGAGAPSISYRPEAQLLVQEARAHLLEAIQTLRPRESKIITLHYGLDGSEPVDLSAIAKMMNVSRNRIQQLHQKGLRVLRWRCRDLSERCAALFVDAALEPTP
jgi:RNA polymerase sigma factor (sigma-70 family)